MSEIKTINEHSEIEGHFEYLSKNEIACRVNDTNYKGLVTETADPKIFEVTLQGKKYFVRIESPLDLLISKMGLNVLDTKDAGDIMSPMPGLVLDIMVKEGDNVEDGQALAILEAMKMENIIKSTGKGVVESISISNGDKVEKGQLLISIKSQE